MPFGQGKFPPLSSSMTQFERLRVTLCDEILGQVIVAGSVKMQTWCEGLAPVACLNLKVLIKDVIDKRKCEKFFSRKMKVLFFSKSVKEPFLLLLIYSSQSYTAYVSFIGYLGNMSYSVGHHAFISQVLLTFG